MQITVVAFGQIAEFMGEQFTIDVPDIAALRRVLESQYPQLAVIKYAIALNKKVVTSNADFSENDEVALMPPYSGG